MSLLQEIIKEMAAGGSVGAGSMAANLSNDGSVRRRDDTKGTAVERDWRSSAASDAAKRRAERAEATDKLKSDPKAKERLLAAKNKLKQQQSLAYRIKKYMGLAEAFDMEDVVSRLKDMEGRNTEDTVTYGVEDDAGNIMKVTVRRDKAPEFEERLSAELFKTTQMDNQISKKKTTSMAELLFNLKNDFEIVDVEFPQIPSNAVYNADKVNYSNDSEAVGGNVDLDNDIEGGDPEGMDGGLGDDPLGGDMGDDMGGDPLAGDGGMGGGMDGSDPLSGGAAGPAAGGLDKGGNPPPGEDMGDDGSVSDFAEPTSTGGVEGLLQSVLAMLKADAEAKKAQAEAEAEKARALQAEYTAKAASASVAQQAELLSMEQSVENQKRKEKDARRISDLAKYRVKQTNGMAAESFSNKRQFIDRMLFENDTLDSVASLMAIRRNINASITDPKDKMLALQELNIRMKRARLKAANDKAQQRQNNQNMQNPQQNQQRNQMNNPQGQQMNNQQLNNPQGQQMNNQQLNNQQMSGRLGSMR